MLQFTRRQYQSILRRGGVKEPGLAFTDNPVLAAIIDDFRMLMPEQTRSHTTLFQNNAAVAGEFALLELVAPPGGLWVHEVGQTGCAGRWGWFVAIGSSINTAQAAGVPNQIQSVAHAATVQTGTGILYFAPLAGMDYATTVERADPWEPIYVPAGRIFGVNNGTANDASSFMVRWREPGV